MKVIGYCRVSSEEQASNGLSLEMQRDKISQYCTLNDYELVETITDAGISAKNITGRPGLQRALDMVMAGEADGLVAWKLDRMFRSTVDALQTAESFRDKGKCLMSISEKLDTCSAMGEFFFSLMASLAQMERRLTGERTKSVLNSKKERGEHVGQVPFGYSVNGKTLECNTEQQNVIQQVKDMARTMSYRQVADALNKQGIPTKTGKCWTHKQISRIAA